MIAKSRQSRYRTWYCSIVCRYIKSNATLNNWDEPAVCSGQCVAYQLHDFKKLVPSVIQFAVDAVTTKTFAKDDHGISHIYYKNQ